MIKAINRLALPILFVFSILMFSACSGPKSTADSNNSGAGPSENVSQNIATIQPTSLPTPTLAPTELVALPIPKLYVLDVTRGGDAPSDLLDYMFDYGGNAGGGGKVCPTGGSPAWENAFNGMIVPAIPKLLDWSAIYFADGKEVLALLKLPDGSELQLNAWLGEGGCTSLRYEIVPGAPLGTYTLELSQGDTKLVDTFILMIPIEPIQVLYRGNHWIAGYKPNEHVDLSLYYHNDFIEFQKPEFISLFKDLPDITKYFNPKELGNFSIMAYLDQQTVVADANGAFLVGFTSERLNELDPNWKYNISIVARGEQSGLVTNRSTIFEGSCNGSMVTRLSIGGSARVTQYVNQTSSYFSDSKLPPGTLVNLVIGPLCFSGPFFSGPPEGSGWEWIVDTAGEKGILVKEADAGGYLLEPVDAELAGQTNPIEPVITPAEAQACPGAEPQRVKVGTTIRVCTQSDRVVLRDVPQIEGMINFRIYKGAEALIVDGPVCANDSSWWKVKVAAGTKVYRTSDFILTQDEEGWVREGSDEVDRYFICPVDK